MYYAVDGPGPQLGALGLEAPAEDPTLVDRVSSSVDDAIGYLRARWGDFLNATPRLIDLQHRAAQLSARFRQDGELEKAEQAKQTIRRLGELNVLHGQLVDRMRQVADVVGVGGMFSGYSTGLGAIPAVQVTIITGIAAGVAWFFRAAALEERKLDMLEDGYSAQDVATAVGESTRGLAPVLAGVGNIGMWVALGIGALIVLRLVESGAFKGLAKRRPKRNPPLVVFDTNPPGGLIGDEVLAVWYQHADDGGLYVHEFGPDVELVALEDGRVCLQHEELPLWQDF